MPTRVPRYLGSTTNLPGCAHEPLCTQPAVTLQGYFPGLLPQHTLLETGTPLRGIAARLPCPDAASAGPIKTKVLNMHHGRRLMGQTRCRPASSTPTHAPLLSPCHPLRKRDRGAVMGAGRAGGGGASGDLTSSPPLGIWSGCGRPPHRPQPDWGTRIPHTFRGCAPNKSGKTLGFPGQTSRSVPETAAGFAPLHNGRCRWRHTTGCSHREQCSVDVRKAPCVMQRRPPDPPEASMSPGRRTA